MTDHTRKGILLTKRRSLVEHNVGGSGDSFCEGETNLKRTKAGPARKDQGKGGSRRKDGRVERP